MLFRIFLVKVNILENIRLKKRKKERKNFSISIGINIYVS